MWMLWWWLGESEVGVYAVKVCTIGGVVQTGADCRFLPYSLGDDS